MSFILSYDKILQETTRYKGNDNLDLTIKKLKVWLELNY